MERRRQEERGSARLLYRVEDAAELLSVSRDRIYELIRSGQLRTAKLGRSRRVPAVSLAEYVRGLTEAPMGAGGGDEAA